MQERESGAGTLPDALIGAAAGALAVWAMDRVDWFNFEHEDAAARKRTQRVRPGGMDPAHVVANKASAALGHEIEPRDSNAAGLAIHYSIGILPGALYGALRRSAPGVTAGHGALFGLGLFLIHDEGLNAITGLSAEPDKYPWQAHARGLVAHLVYGLALETALSVADGFRASGETHDRDRPPRWPSQADSSPGR